MTAIQTREMDHDLPANGGGVPDLNGVAAASGDAPSRSPIDPNLPSARLVHQMGAVGLVCWFVIFALGLLVSSSEYRRALLPRQALVPKGARSETTWTRQMSPERSALGNVPSADTLIVLGKAALTFGPTNIGLLCIAAGLVGGCAANLNWYKIEQLGIADRVPARRSVYLTEHPAAAVMRSFLIYLLLTAGLLAFMPDPFKVIDLPNSQAKDLLSELTNQQGFYSRLAALASVLSFMVGYDPSRFDGLFELVPRLGGGNGKAPTGGK